MLRDRFDSCGLAGGGHTAGGYGGVYKATTLAKQGDYGSKLPPLPTGTVWRAGQPAEVSWAPYANVRPLPKLARARSRQQGADSPRRRAGSMAVVTSTASRERTRR